MFIGRKKELKDLTSELSKSNKKTAVLIYGFQKVTKRLLYSYMESEGSENQP